MASHGTQVQHIEGASYAVAFGDPENNLLSANHTLASRTASFPPYPAAGGLNPYDPERGSETESIIENFIEATNKYDTLFLTCGLVCLWRMCHRDGTLVAFSADCLLYTSPSPRDA